MPENIRGVIISQLRQNHETLYPIIGQSKRMLKLKEKFNAKVKYFEDEENDDEGSLNSSSQVQSSPSKLMKPPSSWDELVSKYHVCFLQL